MKFRDCSALRVTFWNCHDNNVFLIPNQFLCFPRIERRSELCKTVHILHYKMKYLPWSLCSENHSITCWSSSGLLGVKRPIVARFPDILSSPERIVALSLLQRRTMDSLSAYSLAICELFSTASASAITFILKAMEYAERRAFGMTIKITATKEILDWYYCETFVRLTEIVVFLQSHGSIYTLCRINWYSHLHWFAIFSQCFPGGSLTQMTSYNQEFRSRLIADGFTFFCQQHQSVGRSLTFRVSAYSRDRLIGEEIR